MEIIFSLPEISALHFSLIIIGSLVLKYSQISLQSSTILTKILLKSYHTFFKKSCNGSSMLPWAFSSCGEGRGYSSSGTSHCSDFSCCRAQALGHSGFGSCGSPALEQLNSCGTWVQLPYGMYDLSVQEIEPVSLCTGRLILNHWTTRKSLPQIFTFIF